MHGVRPVIGRVYPFPEYREAYRRIQNGGHIGKVVIDVAN
jgi:NADPH:quinone reductase-like Zn-dependent oxidoreductase